MASSPGAVYFIRRLLFQGKKTHKNSLCVSPEISTGILSPWITASISVKLYSSKGYFLVLVYVLLSTEAPRGVDPDVTPSRMHQAGVFGGGQSNSHLRVLRSPGGCYGREGSPVTSPSSPHSLEYITRAVPYPASRETCRCPQSSTHLSPLSCRGSTLPGSAAHCIHPGQSVHDPDAVPAR